MTSFLKNIVGFFPTKFTFGSTLFYIFLFYFIAYIVLKTYGYIYDIDVIKCSPLKWKDIDPFYSEPFKSEEDEEDKDKEKEKEKEKVDV